MRHCRRIKMIVQTYVKNTLTLLVFGLICIVLFGWLLRKRYYYFDFDQRFSKLFFLLDNYELIAGLLIGLVLILIGIWG